MKTNKSARLCASASVAVLASAFLVASPAFAQEASEGDGVEIDTIIVTAQKRAQNAQDVPIALVAASGEQLAATGTTNLKDIGMISSGVTVTDANAYVFPNVRGVGSFVQGSSSASSVAVYIDDVYVPRTTSTALELDNIASVEVLKGPQSTLYGRNATGGALKVNTRTTEPGDPLSARVSVGYGEYNQIKTSAFVEAGLGDMFAFNVSALYAKRDGYVTNLAPRNLDVDLNNFPGSTAKGKNLDSLYTYGGQVKLTFMPSDDFKMTVAVRGTKFNDTASANTRQLNPGVAIFALNAVNAQLGAQFGVPGGLFFGPGPFNFATQYGTSYGHANRRRGSDLNITLAATYDTGSLEFASITSYGKTKLHTSTDLLSANVPTVGFDGVQPSKNFSQELRVSSDYDGMFNFLLGANYFKDQSDGDIQLTSLFGNLPVLGQAATNKDKAVSAFGEIYVEPVENLTLTGGLRYTNEKVKATSVFDLFGIVPSGTTVRVKDNELTWRAVADYKTDFGMLYASVSTGFKSGGQNATNLAGAPFGPEKITAYEVGVKTNLLDNRLHLNASGFYYDFKGIQAALVGGPTGGAQYFVNGQKAKVSGIEADFQGRVTDDLNLYGGITLMFDREYTQFTIAADPIVGIPALSVSGNKLVGASKFSAVAGINYEHKMDNESAIGINLNMNHNSGYFLTIENSLGTGGLANDKAFTLVNGQVSYTLPGGKAKLTAWGRNIFNAKYVRSGLSALGGATILGQDAAPSEFGGTLSFEF